MTDNPVFFFFLHAQSLYFFICTLSLFSQTSGYFSRPWHGTVQWHDFPGKSDSIFRGHIVPVASIRDTTGAQQRYNGTESKSVWRQCLRYYCQPGNAKSTTLGTHIHCSNASQLDAATHRHGYRRESSHT